MYKISVTKKKTKQQILNSDATQTAFIADGRTDVTDERTSVADGCTFIER